MNNTTKSMSNESNAFMAALSTEIQGRASGKLAELVQAVKTHGRQGTLTLKLKLKPAMKGDDATLAVFEDVSITPPKPDPKTRILFAHDDGRLSRTHPDQGEFHEIKALDGGQVHEVNTDSSVKEVQHG